MKDKITVKTNNKRQMKKKLKFYQMNEKKLKIYEMDEKKPKNLQNVRKKVTSNK